MKLTSVSESGLLSLLGSESLDRLQVHVLEEEKMMAGQRSFEEMSRGRKEGQT